MKSLGIVDAGIMTALLMISVAANKPTLATSHQTLSGSIRGAIVAQKTAQVNLNLTVDKQLVKQDVQGRKTVEWTSLKGNVTVQPGDVLRYNFTGKNVSDRVVKNLVVTQPIPRQMVYILSSAGVVGNLPVKLTYSIDNGKTFVESPTIAVKLSNGTVQKQPAPPSAYSHVRWKFTQPIEPGVSVIGNFQVRVR